MSLPARTASTLATRPGCGAGAWLYALVLALVSAAATAAAPAPDVELLRQAERSGATSATVLVTLPDSVELAPGEAGPLRRTYRWRVTLAAPPQGQALYWPGLFAHSVISVNGHVLKNGSAQYGQPLPRSVERLVLINVPDALWRAGENTIELQAVGLTRVSVSALEFGPAAALAARHRDRVLALVVLPALVAAVMVTLGLCMLFVWSRQREALAGYFGASAVAWGLHSAWTISPWALLPSPHHGVWWTAIYGLFVVLLVMFCLRYSEMLWPRFERVLLLSAAAGPVVLYAGVALGRFSLVSDAWRLTWIVAVAVAVVAVSRAAWRRRDTDSLLMALVGTISLLFGVRDWLTSQDETDNNPVYLVPYAGLLFVVIVVRMLVERFVRASRQLATMNTELERRVATQHAALRDALEQMRQARDAAEAADRAKSNFLATASHDLRQPAHALGLYLAALRAEPLGDDQADLVQRMTGSLAALDTMFNALLDISRMDGGAVVPQPAAFALGPLLRRLAEEFAPQAEARGLRLALHLPDAQANTHSDPMLVERIVRNLLANAVKYTAHGGVLLACRLRHGPERQWRVEVWDSGVGIGAADRAHVFDEFYQVGNADRDVGQGLGLGLAIVRRLTRLLGLTLELRSRPGRGSCFALRLPAVAAAAPPGPAQPAPAAAPTLAGMSVAMIEDNADVRDAMRALLQRWGCLVIEGASAAEVLHRMADRAPPRAIVADFRLGAGRTGPAEAALLQAHWGTALPVLIVSGESSPAQLRAIEAAGHACLAKPVPPGPLRQWLEQQAARQGAAAGAPA